MIQRAPRMTQAQRRSLSKFSVRAFSRRSLAVRTSAVLGWSLLSLSALGLSGCQTNPAGLAINQPPPTQPLSNGPLSNGPVAPVSDQYAKDINTDDRYLGDINLHAAPAEQPAARQAAARQPAGELAKGELAAGEPPGGETLTLTSTAADQPALGPSLITLQRGEDLQSYLTGNHRRVVLDFYADWCGPCRKQGKILHELEPLAAETGTLIIKVDVDQHQALARDFAVASLPTLIVINDGEIATRQTGIATAGTLKSWMR